MALTVTLKRLKDPVTESPDIKEGIARVTFDASYPTGGEPIAPSDLDTGINTIHGMTPIAHNAAGAVQDYRYDRVNGKILAFDDLGEEAAATDLSGNIVDFRVLYS